MLKPPYMLISSVNLSRLFHETVYNQDMTDYHYHFKGKKKKKKKPRKQKLTSLVKLSSNWWHVSRRKYIKKKTWINQRNHIFKLFKEWINKIYKVSIQTEGESSKASITPWKTQFHLYHKGLWRLRLHNSINNIWEHFTSGSMDDTATEQGYCSQQNSL